MYLLELSLVTLILIGCNSEHLPWYGSGIVYQIYIRSFLDTDQDGIGNIRGIMQKMDYLESLGISAVLLSPIFPSPNVDFGYDIKDFKDVNPEYGTLEDLDNLVKELKKKGIGLMLDLVPNHSSNQNEWFKFSESRNTTFRNYNDYYVWKDGRPGGQPPNNWVSVNGRGSAWKWSDTRGQYYLHSMLEEEPDLNYANPEVLSRMQEVIEFWTKRDVMGFRIDSASWLYEDQSFSDEPATTDPPASDNQEDYRNLQHVFTVNLPKDSELVGALAAVLERFPPHDLGKRVLMVESYSQTDDMYGSDSEAATIIQLNPSLGSLGRDSTSGHWASVINSYYTHPRASPPNWMVGSSNVRRAASRWSPEWVDALNIIVLSLKGAAVSYFGEEIGLDEPSLRWDQVKDRQGLLAGPQRFEKHTRDFQRAPFPWDSSHLAGFSSSSTTWLPLSASYWRLNVEAQEVASRSHLKVYKSMVQLRKKRTMAEGECTALGSEDGLLHITRSLNGSQTIISIVNVGDRHVYTDLKGTHPNLPETVKLLVSSQNFVDYNRDSLSVKRISLPPKSAIVISM